MDLHTVLKRELKDFPLYSQDWAEDTKVIVTFEMIWFWKWHFTEYDPKTQIGFAYVEWFENEYGSVSIPELMDTMKSEHLLWIFTLYKPHMSLSKIKEGL